MFDLGWGELLIIGVVALIVVGPNDLPGMFRTLGRFTGKVKRMARDFQRAMDDAADEAGVKEAADVMKGATNPSNMGLNKLNEAAKKFDDWDPTTASKDYGKAGKAAGAADATKADDTPALSEERAEAAKKIHEYSAKKTAENRAAEAKAEAAKAAKATKAKATKAKATKAKATKAKATKAKAKPDTKPEDSA